MSDGIVDPRKRRNQREDRRVTRDLQGGPSPQFLKVVAGEIDARRYVELNNVAFSSRLASARALAREATIAPLGPERS